MSTIKTKPASQAPIPQPSSQPTVPLPPTPTPEKIRAQIDLSITLLLSLWPSLTLAVTNQWGGPLSSSKREWFAGAVSDFLASRPINSNSKSNPTNSSSFPSFSSSSMVEKEELEEDLEEMLLQVMNDEFEVVVEDGSAAELAREMVRLRGECVGGVFEGVGKLWDRWVGRGGEGFEGVFRRGEDEGEGGEDSEEDGNVDVDMGEAPVLVEKEKEKILPEVDEEGFTKVVGKKRR
ncbi:MAG: hypothetical protein M1836_008025 [Candelina mexicana]|nr:MAG: hypothetical protein M1836_008025 [Candelina mexicana]